MNAAEQSEDHLIDCLRKAVASDALGPLTGAVDRLAKAERRRLAQVVIDVVGEDRLLEAAGRLNASDRTKLFSAAAGAIDSKHSEGALRALDQAPRIRLLRALVSIDADLALQLVRDELRSRHTTEQEDLALETDDVLRRVRAAAVAPWPSSVSE